MSSQRQAQTTIDARELAVLLEAIDRVIDTIERDEAHEGGLLGRDSLKLVGKLRHERARWALP